MFVNRSLQEPLTIILQFREFTDKVLSHAKDRQTEQELADKVGYQTASPFTANRC